MVVRKRLDITGPAMVFVTTTVKEWTPLFENTPCAQAALKQLAETLDRYNVSLSAWVLMPSHLHVMLGLPEIELLSKVIGSFKSLAARRLRPIVPSKWRDVFETGGKFSLWRPRFDDLVIWSEKQFRVKVEYIHSNPVRAGLVAKAEDYPLSSAGDWLCGRPGKMAVDREWNWLDGSKD